MHVTVHLMGAGPGLVHPAEAMGHTPLSPANLAGRRRRSSLLSWEGMVGGGSSAVPSPEMRLGAYLSGLCVLDCLWYR